MIEIYTLLHDQVPGWALILALLLFWLYNAAVQCMPEPKDVAAGWWYQWLFDIAHTPAGNWKLIAKAYKRRRDSRLLG